MLGQADFTTSTQAGTAATTLDGPSGVCLDLSNGKMYIADEDDHRVLRFAYPLTSDQQAAEAVLGQADFTSSSTGTTAATMNNPSGCAVGSGGVLFVSDQRNNRILRFDSAHTKASGADADGVLGQADFTSGNDGTNASRLDEPEGLALDGDGRLYVADRVNNRVLRFDNAASKADGADADGVLGQADFTSSSGGVTASRIESPYDVAVDSDGRLYVAESFNSRVLRFDDAASKADGADADGVLGQADFTSRVASSTSASSMTLPYGVAVDASGRLYVADNSGKRVLFFDDAASKSNGADADGVLGQADFTSGSSSTTASGLNLQARSDIAIDDANEQVYVTDTSNNRLLGFEASSTALPVELTHFTATRDGATTYLAWTTATETNNAGFELQHRAPRTAQWAVNAFIPGHGTTLQTQAYDYRLTDLAPGTHRFRLKQIDYDGTFDYSPEVEVTVALASAYQLSAVYPNPFQAEAVFTLAVREPQLVRVAVYDALGREVALLHEGTLSAEASHRFTVAGEAWSSGLYLLRVQGERMSATRALTLVK
ncbi:MAG: T9SS type A sorting domain-containing protein [Bacteroidota bacterium]